MVCASDRRRRAVKQALACHQCVGDFLAARIQILASMFQWFLHGAIQIFAGAEMVQHLAQLSRLVIVLEQAAGPGSHDFWQAQQTQGMACGRSIEDNQIIFVGGVINDL